MLAAFGAMALGAHRGASVALGPDSRISLRLATSALLLFAGMYLAFLASVVIGQFNRGAAILLGGIAAAGLHRSGGIESAVNAACQDMRGGAHALRGLLRTPEGVLLTLALVLAATKLSFGLFAPPLGHDALLYHYLKAARWVQSGAFQFDPMPGPWSSYEFYPFAGQALWAWGMLFTGSDTLVAAFGVGAWLALLLGAYAAARALGASQLFAAGLACAIALVPATATAMTSGNVENITAAAMLIGVPLLHRAWHERSLACAVLASIALGMAAATKSHGLPLIAGAFPVVLVAAWRIGRVGACARTIVAITLCGAWSYLRAWIERGSPLFPFALVVGGRTLLPGDPEMTTLFSGGLLPPETLELYTTPNFFRMIFFERAHETWQHINLGPGAAILIVLGVVGATHLLRRGERAVLLSLLAPVAILLVNVFSDQMTGQRTIFLHMIGRFLALPLAAIALLAAPCEGRIARGLVLFAGFTGLVYSLPFGIRPDVFPSLLLTLLLLSATLTLCVAASRMIPRRATALCAVIVLLTGSVQALDVLRARMRYECWSLGEDERRPLYDMHPIDWRVARCWPIWATLDSQPPSRIAFTSGWSDSGHNAGRYPLLGSRFQHEVFYISPMVDGSPLEPRLATDQIENASYHAWLARLRDQRIDAIVSVEPDTIVLSWMREHPETFESEISGVGGASWLYRLRPESPTP
jgi:hypothetical protein